MKKKEWLEQEIIRVEEHISVLSFVLDTLNRSEEWDSVEKYQKGIESTKKKIRSMKNSYESYMDILDEEIKMYWRRKCILEKC